MQQKSYYRPSYLDENLTSEGNIVIPWDKYTAIGVAVSAGICVLILLVFLAVEQRKGRSRNIQIGSVPTVILNFGLGDGTGISSGNLTKEGAAQKGEDAPSNLHDASTATSTRQASETSTATLEESSNVVAVSELSGERTREGSEAGDATETIGTPDGSWGGRGLGDSGSGRGKGYGLGDIDWGGGGNRIIVGEKYLPDFPKNVRVSATIKLKFWVAPDGTVARIVPIKRADPRLEQAAMEAIKKWRFNPIKDQITMVGVIPITFTLK